MESAPTIRKAIAVKKTMWIGRKQGLRVRNAWLTALSVSLTTATSPRVRGRFDEKNTSKDHIVKHGVPANPDLWGEGATTLKVSNDDLHRCEQYCVSCDADNT